MATNQSALTIVGETRSIEEIRKSGLDKQLKERITTERTEMQRIKDQSNGGQTPNRQPTISFLLIGK